MPRVVLVTGATGKQGGAVINNLLQAESDFIILAVTRTATSPSAQRLAEKSQKIRLVQGDLDDPVSIFANARKVASGPIWGVYSVQAAVGNGQTAENEEKQGKALIDESIRSGVKHFVYSSVDRGGDKSYENPTPVPHFASKHRVEHHLLDKTSSGQMDWTILRPTGFLDNYVPGFQGKIFLTAWKVALRNRPQQVIAVSDIGYFAAQAFIHPEKYRGQAISLAGDELTFDEAAKVFKEKTANSLPTTFGFVASLVLYTAKEVGVMFKWFQDEGFGADIQEVKKLHPGLVDFGTYIEKQSGFVTK
ncbi:nucleoside-diphosphate-sugar epimerase family protein [Bisporella sp. PMI_857]|nr:nucleoside-diphosphate-sugar epimerase family protein [Bisporella sp. PMI_857]